MWRISYVIVEWYNVGVRLLVLTVCCGLAIAACETGGGQSQIDDEGSGGSGGDGGISLSVGVGGSNAGGGAPEITEVFGHASDTLYRLDPLTKEVTVVGVFSGCTNVIDIAIDKNNQIIGTTSNGLYRIDKNTASCSMIQSGNFPNSLSYVPEGTLDPAIEALVGYEGEDYVRIDPNTGTVLLVGSLGNGLQSSGDIVSVEGGGTYLTVSGNNCSDCIVEVNPANGSLVQNFGSLGYPAVYGIAFWGGSAYGFSNGGDLFEIVFTPTGVTTQAISIPGAPGNLQFWGAGSSTAVPLEVPL